MASQIVEPIHFPDKIDRKSPLLGSLFLFFVLFITFLFVYVLYICAHRHRHRRNTNISPPHAGLDPTTISSLPVSAIKNNPSQAAAECAICLSMFQEGEKVKVVPFCRHGFHSDCVDEWLRTRSSCPLCRGRVDSQSRELDLGMRLP